MAKRNKTVRAAYRSSPCADGRPGTDATAAAPGRSPARTNAHARSKNPRGHGPGRVLALDMRPERTRGANRFAHAGRPSQTEAEDAGPAGGDQREVLSTTFVRAIRSAERFAVPVRPTGMGFRRGSAAAAVVAAVAGMLVLAEPAAACSCAIPRVDKALAEGHVVAIVTRTDDDTSDVATLRVEDAVGGELPSHWTGPLGFSGCEVQVLADGLAAIAFRQEGAEWKTGGCAFDLGEVLQKVRGRPVVEAKPPAVALAAGSFGGSRLAALDRRGRVVAWDRQAGTGQAAAVCPGGSTVAAFGRSGGVYDVDRRAEVSVHDAATLKVRRTVVLPKRPTREALAIRCLGAQGKRVEVVVHRYGAEEGTHLLTVDGGRVSSVPLGHVSAADATGDGFLLAIDKGGWGTEGPVSLEWLRGDGTQSVLAESDLPYVEHLKVSPDGATIALYATEVRGRRLVRTLDAATGRQLGEWVLDAAGPDRHVNGLGWTAGNELLVRSGEGRAEADPNLRRFDRGMRELGRGTANAGWRFAVVGDGGVSFDDARIRVAEVGAAPLEVAEPRLAAAKAVVPLSGKGFVLPVRGGDGGDGADGEDATGGLLDVLDEPGGAPNVVGITGAIGGMSLLAGGAALLLRRRRRA